MSSAPWRGKRLVNQSKLDNRFTTPPRFRITTAHKQEINRDMDEDRWRMISSGVCPTKCDTYDGFSSRAQTCPVVPTYDGAGELIRKSLIRFDPGQEKIRPIRRREDGADV